MNAKHLIVIFEYIIYYKKKSILKYITYKIWVALKRADYK